MGEGPSLFGLLMDECEGLADRVIGEAPQQAWLGRLTDLKPVADRSHRQDLSKAGEHHLRSQARCGSFADHGIDGLA